MNSMFLSGGFIINPMDPVLKSNPNLALLVKHLATFEVKTALFGTELPQIDEKSSVLAVIHNLISRGIPTYASSYLEDVIVSKHLKYFVPFSINGKIGHKFTESYNFIDVAGSFGVNPTITTYRRVKQKMKADSNFEASLIGWIEVNFGSWLLTLISQQVNISDLTDGDNEFQGQRVDYVLAFPSVIESLKGIVIEMDGPQHQTNVEERDLDKRRNNKLLSYGYDTIRVRTNSEEDWSNLKNRLNRYLAYETFNFVNKPETCTSDSNFHRLVVSPVKIAQVQLVVLKAILANPNWINSKRINIGLIQRDCDGLEVSFQDLNNWLSVFKVLVPNTAIPNIDVEILNPEVHLPDHGKYNAIVDVAAYYGSYDLESLAYPNLIEIRSAPFYANGDRRFVTGELIKYESFGSFDNSTWITKNNDAVDALTYLLRSIFRKESFRDGQLPIINRALQLKSVIGLLPTGAGKSLTYQFSALLQPGVCVVIDPIISLMHDQYTGLNNHWIDSSIYINSTIKTPQERTRRQKQIADAKALFFFVSPERLLIDDFRSYLSSMSENNAHPVFFNYCVIDEAHCVSEWGHDFRTSYLSVAENASRFCKVKSTGVISIPIFALTATASYDVLSDIQRELSGHEPDTTIGEESIVQYETSMRKELTFRVLGLKNYLDVSATGYPAKEILSEVKKEHIKEIVDTKKDLLADGAGLIFCPHRSHLFGITDRFKASENQGLGIMDYLIRENVLSSHHIGFFMGSDEKNEQVQLESMKNQDAFINNELKLLVATKAFGMGIDKENVRFTVHVNYPSSIESFLQEAGRAGRDRKESDCYLLFSDTPYGQYDDIEFEVNQYFHERSFRGEFKEKAVLNELLYEINDPDRTYQITTDIQAKFDEEEIVVSSYTSRAGNRYIELQMSDREKIGSLMVSNFWNIYYAESVTNNNFPIDADKAKSMMDYLKDIMRTKGNPDNAWKWLHSSGDKREGIIQLINKGACTTKFKSGVVTLTWQNNITERVSKIQLFIKRALKRNGVNYTDNDIEKMVSKVVVGASSAANFNDLVDEINIKLSRYEFDLRKEARILDEQRKDTPSTLIKNLEFYYNQLRDKTDTEKAIYRLRLIGLIDDYTVDYRTQSFTLYFSKKSDAFYKKRLRFYLSKFMSDDRVEKEIQQASKLPGEQLVEKYLNYLVSYSYSQVAKKRERSIQDMRDACKYGLEKNSKEFAEYLDLYLNSKYFRDEYFVGSENESLRFRLDDGKIEDMAYFDHYVDLMTKDGNSEINNLKHLRGASLRMLRVTTQNPVLLSLAAFSTFILDFKSDSLVQEAQVNLTEAFEVLEERQGWSDVSLEEFFNNLVQLMTSKKPEITEYISFELESFRMKSVLKSLVSINELVNNLNNNLFNHG